MPFPLPWPLVVLIVALLATAAAWAAGGPVPAAVAGLAGLAAAGIAIVAERRAERRTARVHDRERRDLEARLAAIERDEADALRRVQAGDARWGAILRSAVDAIVVIDEVGRVETFNPAAERMFGWTAAEIAGRNISVVMPPPYRDEHDGYLRRYLETSEPHIIGIGREVTGLRKDGSTFPVHLSVGEARINGQRRFTGILHDLTARVQIEEQLREGAALAKLGELAAMIAHEVKNPLAGIRGAIQVFSTRQAPDSPERPVLAEIVTRIDALDALIKDILLFARPPQPRLAPVSLATLAASTAELLGSDPLFAGVRVTVTGTCGPILADGGLLQIVLHNLFVNAAQALEGTGRIDVTLRAGDGACHLAIADDGPGIPPDVRARVFMPFVTTKARGSGLGLATARRLIEAHRGTIALEPRPGGGTVVSITLPATQS